MSIELDNQFMLVTYESGGLTKAAQMLGISQPALSMRMSKAEEKLGFKVFDRTTVPIGLTGEGSIYLEYLKKQEILIRDYERRIEEFQNGENGQLIIGGPSLYLETMIADAVMRIHKQYPECHIKLKNASMPELLEQAENGMIDCFISTSDELPDNFEAVRVKREQLYLCIPVDWEINKQMQAYRIAVGDKGNCFDYHNLDGMPFIAMEENQPLQKELSRFLYDYKIQPKNVLQVNQVTTGMKLSALGEGIFLASEEAIINCGHVDKIAVYALPEDFSGRQIYVAYDKTHYRSKACRELIAILPIIGERGKAK